MGSSLDARRSYRPQLGALLRKLLAVFSCVVGIGSIREVRADAPGWIEPQTRLSVRGYSIEDGLSNLPVYHLRQDWQGFLWISNEEGLFRYDGERFRRFGLEDGL